MLQTKKAKEFFYNLTFHYKLFFFKRLQIFLPLCKISLLNLVKFKFLNLYNYKRKKIKDSAHIVIHPNIHIKMHKFSKLKDLNHHQIQSGQALP
jgi:hypothetical protein